jgi:LEA14-like dessication related protein
MAKTKTSTKLLIGGASIAAAGAAVYYIYQKKQAVASLNVNISKVDFNKQKKTLVVFLRLINPSNASLNIKSIVADVIWQGSAAATIDYRTPIVIKPLDEKILELPVKLNLNLATIVTSLLTSKISDVVNGKFEIKGTINAENLVVPFEYAKDIKLINDKK